MDAIISAVSQLSDQAISAAERRADEAGFNKDRGGIPFDEAMRNLKYARDSILGVAKGPYLTTLPFSVKTSILSVVQPIVSALQDIANGSDRCPELAELADRLYALVMQYHIDQRGAEFPGYEERSANLKHLISNAEVLRDRLEQAVTRADSIGDIVARAGAAGDAIDKALTEALGQLQQSEAGSQRIGALVATAEATDNQIASLVAAATTGRDSVATMEDSLKSLYTDGQAFRKTIVDTTADAARTLAADREETETLLKQVQAVRIQADEALLRATGESLFHSFDTRQRQISRAKWIWVGLLAASVILLMRVAMLIAYSALPFTAALTLKLAMVPPTIFALWFCSVQYNRERRLEEQYAFKSNISISLTPYKKLVSEVLPGGQADAQARYAEFIIGAVNQVFTPPTDSGDGARLLDIPLDKAEAILSSLAKAVGPIVKAVRP